MSNHISKEELKRINSLKQEKLFVRVAESSEMTGLSISHLWQLIRENKIKSYLPSPKTRLIEVSCLINYIKNNTEVQNDK